MNQFANRGKSLEDWIEYTNNVYNSKGKAVINKIPTSWKILRNKTSCNHDRRSIQAAFPEKKSTVDFGGTAANFSVWFDVKQTGNKKSFPLINIHDHQIEYLKKVAEQGGKAFFIIYSKELKKTWILWIDQLLKFKSEANRKSIPFDWFDANCDIVPKGNGVILDYLPLILRRNGV
jgi:recombination protein U